MLSYGNDGNKYRYVGAFPSKEEYKVYYFYKQGKHLLTYGYGEPSENEASKLLVISSMLRDVGSSVRIGVEPLKVVMEELAKHYAVEVAIHPEYKTAFERITALSAGLQERWYKDIYAHYDISPDDPVGQLVMSKAWEDGHASGLQQVDHYIDKYLDLVTEIAAVCDRSRFFRNIA